ncbi:MAG: hypothetical protein IPJ17_06755 [Holophagales bacterium]|nr:MAG: hypothetical protein IPJ17_06755 [Holophagales bacterium]
MGFVLARALVFAALALVLGMLGSAIDRLSGRRIPLPAPRAAGQLLLGTLVATALLFGLAAGGTLSRVAVLLLAAVAVASWAACRLFVRAPISTGSPASAGADRWSLPARAAAVLVAALFAGLFLEALNPYPAWDAQVYHLTLPKLWLAAGGFVRVPFNVYSNWPSNFQLLFAAAIAAGDALVATLLHWGAALLLVVLLWHHAESPRGELPNGERRVLAGFAGAIAAILLLANDLVLFEARAAYVDLAAALALLVAYLLAEEGLERDGERAHLLAAGAALGYLAGLKTTGALGAVALGGVVAIVELRRAGGGRAMRALAWLALPACALLLPWLVRSAVQTGNPFYPLFWERFGGPEWSSDLATRLAQWQRSIGMGREPLDYFLLPWRVVTQGDAGYDHFDGRLGPLWLALLPLAVGQAHRRRVRRPLAVAALAFAFWAASAQQLRFLLPALALAALACGRAVALLLGGIDRRATRHAVATLLGLVALAALVPPAARELASTPTLARRFLADGERVLAMAVPPPFRAIEELTPPDARVALLNTNQTYFCPRTCVADSFFEASQLAAALGSATDAAGARERFAALGVTHLLVDARPRGIEWSPGVVALVADRTRADPLWISPDGRFTLLGLR